MTSDTSTPLATVRADLLARLAQPVTYDLAVVGGGATGLGVALDAAARGFSVVLLESHDFAKGTSSRATKLVHGGKIVGTQALGLQAFGNAEEIDVNTVAVPGITFPAVTQALLTLAETRRDCMVLPDPPATLDVESVIDWVDGAGWRERCSYPSGAAERLGG